MDENPQKQASDILMKALAPAPKQPEPVEQDHRETDEPGSENAELDESQANKPEMAEPEQGEQDISTLNHLAETLDIDIADMYALGFNIDGADEPVTLGTLKDHWQQTRDIDKARQELDREREQIKADREQGPELPPQEVVQAQAVLMAIQTEWQELEASGLKTTDAGQYSAKMLDIQNRYNQAQQYAGQVGQVMEQKRVERMTAAQRQLHERVPELADDSKREAISGRVERYIQKFGFKPEDLAKVEDARLMHLVIEASALAEQKGSLRKKRIDTAPKVLKPGQVRESQAGKDASLKRLTEKARQSGQTRDKMRAVSALLKRG